MSTDIATQFRAEGQPAFPVDTENDNSADSSSGEETTNDQGQSDEDQEHSDGAEGDQGEGDKGFADDPAWKKREGTWKSRFNEQETRHTQELQKLREEMEAKLAGLAPKGEEKSEAVKIPSWFGGNEQQWSEFQEWNKSLVEQAKTGAVKEIATKEENESKHIEEATKFFNDEVTAIESDKEINPQGVKVDRNKLLLTAQKFDLVDSKGRWNYRAAWQFMKNQGGAAKADATNEKKKVGGATVSGDRTPDSPKKFMTSEDFKKPGARPW